MSWDKLDSEHHEQRKKARENAEQEKVNLIKLYHRVFKSDDGQKVLADLTAKFIYNNNTPLNADNINYEAAYHDGEAGTVKYIINTITKAEKV